MGDKITPHFKWAELDRHGEARADPVLSLRLRLLAEQLEKIRARVGAAISVTPHGGFHGPTFDREWRRRSPGSEHRQATAADLKCAALPCEELARVIEDMIREGALIDGGVGVYPSDEFTHYDIRTVHGERPARWRG